MPAKRLVDLSWALAGLVVLSPVLLGVALAVLVTDGRPILFRQLRPGLHGKPFTIYKFRTMRATKPGEVWYLTDDERLTRLGMFLRSSSLDEIPELWNVARGEMSLVGPRPLLMEYLGEYTPDERRRHDMRPGVTGWAVVNGRNLLQFKDRIALDLWYVDNWSVALDARILAMTVLRVLRRSGVTATEDLALGFPLPGAAIPGAAEAAAACDEPSPGGSGPA